MLRIRLQRRGRRNQPSYKIVVADRKAPIKGKFVDIVGFVNPTTKEREVDAEKVTDWLSKGAQPTPTVHNLLVDLKIIEGSKVTAWKPKPKEQSDDDETVSGDASEEATEEDATKNEEVGEEEDEAPPSKGADSAAEKEEEAEDAATEKEQSDTGENEASATESTEEKQEEDTDVTTKETEETADETKEDTEE